MGSDAGEENKPASTSGTSSSPTFLPSRDLPPLRRGADPQQAQAVLHGLEALEVALGLTREEEVRLIIDGQDEEEIKGSTTAQRGTKEQDQDDDYSGASGSSSSHDEVERRYAQSWLTRIASGNIELPSLGDDDTGGDLVDRAARALAALCGRPASSAQITAFLFCTSTSTSADAAVVARARIGDVPITADALGNRTWGSAPLLARRLVGSWAARKGKESETRVLELGAGTGLVGLALAATAAAAVKEEGSTAASSPSSSHQGGIHLDLTDYHPHVLANLDANARLNGFDEQSEGDRGKEAEVGVRVRKLDWQAIHEEAQGAASSSRYTSTAQTIPNDFEAQGRQPPYLQTLEQRDSEPTYDILIAADCIYDVHHPTWIRSVAERYLSRPQPSSDDSSGSGGGGGGGVLWLITPLRETHKAELQAIYEAFPLAKKRGDGGKGRRQKETLCITWQGDEVGYDDFGPKNFCAGGEGGHRSGLRTTYRTFEVRWV